MEKNLTEGDMNLVAANLEGRIELAYMTPEVILANKLFRELQAVRS